MAVRSTTPATTRPITGCVTVNQTSAATKMSSPNDAAQLENGSGVVLIARRVLALIPCEESASVPHSSAAAILQGSATSPNTAKPRTAAAGGRMNVWMASQTESTAGTLSATNSIR